MRRAAVVVSLVIACNPGPHEAPAAAEPVVAAAPTTPAVVTPAVAKPVAAPASAPAPTLSVGPNRYDIPRQMRCDDMERGPFCGVHIIELADGRVTTLKSRDGAWFIRAGKAETPVAVQLVKVPGTADQLRRVEPLFTSGPGTLVSVDPPHPSVPEPFMLPELRHTIGDFVVVGDKLYVAASLDGMKLVEIDPKTRSFRALPLPGKQAPYGVWPAGQELALYLTGKRTKSVALFDITTQALSAEIEVPRPLAAECLRTGHHYDEGETLYVPAARRFYVGFSCYPDA